MRVFENVEQHTRSMHRSVKQWTQSDLGQLVTWFAAFAMVTLCLAGISLLKDHLQ